MSIYPESQLGIWLNTPIKFLETTAEHNLRCAQNDSRWNNAANDAVCDIDTSKPTLLYESDSQATLQPSGKSLAAAVAGIPTGMADSFLISITLPLNRSADSALAEHGTRSGAQAIEQHLKGLNELFVIERVSESGSLVAAMLRATRNNNHAFGLYQREGSCCLVQRSVRWRLLEAVDRQICRIRMKLGSQRSATCSMMIRLSARPLQE